MENNLDECVIAYDKTQKYTFDNNIILNWYASRVINKYSKNLKVLDLGLGHGIVAKIFSKYFDDYMVLDGSSVIIEEFKNDNPDFKGKIQEVFFEDFDANECYDLIIMGFILEHVEDPLEILNKYKKYLKPNGKIIVAVPNAEAMNRRIGYYAGLLDNLFKLSDMDRQFGHLRYFNKETLRNLIDKADLKEVNIEGIYLKPITTDQIISLDFDSNILNAFCELGILYPELSLGIMIEMINDSKEII